MPGFASVIFSLPIRSPGDAPKNKTDPLEQHLVLIKRFASDREDEAVCHMCRAGDLRATKDEEDEQQTRVRRGILSAREIWT